MTDIIILLNGNHCPVRVNDKDVKSVTELIEKGMRAGLGITSDPMTFFRHGETTVILTKNILGYYTKNVVETSQEKSLKILQEVADNAKKITDSSSEGDSWKNG